MMDDSNKDDEWENIVDITHNVVNNMAGRGSAFDRTLATVLNVVGDYEVEMSQNEKKMTKTFNTLNSTFN